MSRREESFVNDLFEWIEEVFHTPWATVAAIVIGAFVLSRLIVRLVRPLLLRAASRTSASWDDKLVQAVASPVSALFAIQGLRFALPWAPVTIRADTMIRDVIALLTVITVMWMVFRGIDVVQLILEQRSWAIDRPSSRSLIAIAARFAKVFVLILTLIAGLAALGVSVGSLLAGLGIGGLAIALAAQKTVENLFGTLSIGVDQPMREGDFVKLYDFVGTVEQIGLRSTRIRTLDRTVITVPNGELASQRVESYTARDRFRLACTIGVAYGTTAEQLRGVLADLEGILRGHTKIWPDAVVVRFKEFAESSLAIEIMAWFQVADWGEFQLVRQDVLIAFMEAIERRGTSIAFPTRTLHLAGDARPALPDATR
jgi:MscS family membrane protein